MCGLLLCDSLLLLSSRRVVANFDCHERASAPLVVVVVVPSCAPASALGLRDERRSIRRPLWPTSLIGARAMAALCKQLEE